MKAMKVISTLIALFVSMPIWYYLMYKILTLVQATELMWFLYWIYLPFGLFASLLAKLVEVLEKK